MQRIVQMVEVVVVKEHTWQFPVFFDADSEMSESDIEDKIMQIADEEYRNRPEKVVKTLHYESRMIETKP